MAEEKSSAKIVGQKMLQEDFLAMNTQEKIGKYNQWIASNISFIKKNECTLEIFQGNLEKYVNAILRATLSTEYYTQIKDRILPINVLQQFVSKVAKTYTEAPKRTLKDENEKDTEILEYYVDQFNFNDKMALADEYATLFKGYTLDPFIKSANGEPKLRVLPFDKFLPYSFDDECPEDMTDFIKFMGSRDFITVDENGKELVQEVDTYIAYSKHEIIPFGNNGLEIEEMRNDDGSIDNPFGVIPQTYANRGLDQLIPVQDSDMLQIVKMVAVMLTDLEGAIMFKCFNIIYGVDIDMSNLASTPNAMWEVHTHKDSATEHQGKLGSIENNVASEKVIEFILTVLSMWLETKGVKTGGVGQTKSDSSLSGLSKIMDAMDTYELRKNNIKSFKREEKEFWGKIKVMHNYWVTSGMLEKPLITGTFEVIVEFEEPKPIVTRQEKRDNVIQEYKEGLLDIKSAIEKLNPDFDMVKLDEILVRLGIDLNDLKPDEQEEEDNEV